MTNTEEYLHNVCAQIYEEMNTNQKIGKNKNSREQRN